MFVLKHPVMHHVLVAAGEGAVLVYLHGKDGGSPHNKRNNNNNTSHREMDVDGVDPIFCYRFHEAGGKEALPTTTSLSVSVITEKLVLFLTVEERENSSSFSETRASHSYIAVYEDSRLTRGGRSRGRESSPLFQLFLLPDIPLSLLSLGEKDKEEGKEEEKEGKAVIACHSAWSTRQPFRLALHLQVEDGHRRCRNAVMVLDVEPLLLFYVTPPEKRNLLLPPPSPTVVSPERVQEVLLFSQFLSVRYGEMKGMLFVSMHSKKREEEREEEEEINNDSVEDCLIVSVGRLNRDTLNPTVTGAADPLYVVERIGIKDQSPTPSLFLGQPPSPSQRSSPCIPGMEDPYRACMAEALYAYEEEEGGGRPLPSPYLVTIGSLPTTTATERGDDAEAPSPSQCSAMAIVQCWDLQRPGKPILQRRFFNNNEDPSSMCGNEWRGVEEKRRTRKFPLVWCNRRLPSDPSFCASPLPHKNHHKSKCPSGATPPLVFRFLLSIKNGKELACFDFSDEVNRYERQKEAQRRQRHLSHHHHASSGSEYEEEEEESILSSSTIRSEADERTPSHREVPIMDVQPIFVTTTTTSGESPNHSGDKPDSDTLPKRLSLKPSIDAFQLVVAATTSEKNNRRTVLFQKGWINSEAKKKKKKEDDKPFYHVLFLSSSRGNEEVVERKEKEEGPFLLCCPLFVKDIHKGQYPSEGPSGSGNHPLLKPNQTPPRSCVALLEGGISSAPSSSSPLHHLNTVSTYLAGSGPHLLCLRLLRKEGEERNKEDWGIDSHDRKKVAGFHRSLLSRSRTTKGFFSFPLENNTRHRTREDSNHEREEGVEVEKEEEEEDTDFITTILFFLLREGVDREFYFLLHYAKTVTSMLYPFPTTTAKVRAAPHEEKNAQGPHRRRGRRQNTVLPLSRVTPGLLELLLVEKQMRERELGGCAGVPDHHGESGKEGAGAPSVDAIRIGPKDGTLIETLMEGKKRREERGLSSSQQAVHKGLNTSHSSTLPPHMRMSLNPLRLDEPFNHKSSTDGGGNNPSTNATPSLYGVGPLRMPGTVRPLAFPSNSHNNNTTTNTSNSNEKNSNSNNPSGDSCLRQAHSGSEPVLQPRLSPHNIIGQVRNIILKSMGWLSEREDEEKEEGNGVSGPQASTFSSSSSFSSSADYGLHFLFVPGDGLGLTSLQEMVERRVFIFIVLNRLRKAAELLLRFIHYSGSSEEGHTRGGGSSSSSSSHGNNNKKGHNETLRLYRSLSMLLFTLEKEEGIQDGEVDPLRGSDIHYESNEHCTFWLSLSFYFIELMSSSIGNRSPSQGETPQTTTRQSENIPVSSDKGREVVSEKQYNILSLERLTPEAQLSIAKKMFRVLYASPHRVTPPVVSVTDQVGLLTALLLPQRYCGAQIKYLLHFLQWLVKGQYTDAYSFLSDGEEEKRKRGEGDTDDTPHHHPDPVGNVALKGDDDHGPLHQCSLFLTAAVEGLGNDNNALQRYLDESGDIQSCYYYLLFYGSATAAATVPSPSSHGKKSHRSHSSGSGGGVPPPSSSSSSPPSPNSTFLYWKEQYFRYLAEENRFYESSLESLFGIEVLERRAMREGELLFAARYGAGGGVHSPTSSGIGRFPSPPPPLVSPSHPPPPPLQKSFLAQTSFRLLHRFPHLSEEREVLLQCNCGQPMHLLPAQLCPDLHADTTTTTGIGGNPPHHGSTPGAMGSRNIMRNLLTIPTAPTTTASMTGEDSLTPGMKAAGGGGASNTKDGSVFYYCSNPDCHHGQTPLCIVCGERLKSSEIKNNKMTMSDLKNKNNNHNYCWCTVCLHGGHYVHIAEWFSKHRKCPVESCPCHCGENNDDDDQNGKAYYAAHREVEEDTESDASSESQRTDSDGQSDNEE